MSRCKQPKLMQLKSNQQLVTPLTELLYEVKKTFKIGNLQNNVYSLLARFNGIISFNYNKNNSFSIALVGGLVTNALLLNGSKDNMSATKSYRTTKQLHVKHLGSQ